MVPTGVLSNGPRLPTIAPSSPGLLSTPWGGPSAHAHSPAPGFALVAASFAHLNGVLMTLPPSVLNVSSGPRQYTAKEGPWAGACAFVTQTVPKHSTKAPGIVNHLDLIMSQPPGDVTVREQAIPNLNDPSTISGRWICDDGPGGDGEIGQDGIPATSPNTIARASSSLQGRRGPRTTSRFTSAAPWRRSSGDELFLIGFPPKLLIPSALKDDDDPGLVERGGTQLEDKVGHGLPVPARDLEAAGPNILD